MLHKKLAREIKSLLVCCSHKEEGCEWEGELGQLPNHLNPEVGHGQNGCGYVIVECSYECGVYLRRRNMREHEMEIYPKHPIEMQVAGLMRKFEAIVTENQLLRQELHVIKTAREKEIQEIKSTYESELCVLKQELDEVKSKNNRFCDKLKEKHTMLKSEVKETLKRFEEKCFMLHNDKIPLSLPPFHIEMSNIGHHLEYNLNFVSDPFYSHPGGYKMGISVYNSSPERGSGGTHISLYVLILRGEFDDQLKWPFDGEVTVQAYNHSQRRWCREKKIRLNDRECGLDVVGRQVGPLISGGWGYPIFLPYSEFKVQFVKDTNTASFRIMGVKVFSQ
jgi:TNF receptor-associated factor 4